MNTNQNEVIFTDGFAFIEFSATNPVRLINLFFQMGFKSVGKHRTKNIFLFSQGNIKFMLNTENGGNAAQFRTVHRSGVSSMGFCVRDIDHYLDTAISRGATSAKQPDFDIPAIEGVGGSLIYFQEAHTLADFFAREFDMDEPPASPDSLLVNIDHVTHNVNRGNLQSWVDFYQKILDFRKIRSFEIHGAKTGLVSHAMESPCGKIRIPINESADDLSQIEEFLHAYNGEGIQHIALTSKDIYRSVRVLRSDGLPFQSTPDTYYSLVDKRLPEHGEDVNSMRELGILLDGGEAQGGGKLLQIFTKDLIGPIFFEVIQRKGNRGFGEGNFQALFESIELDQIRRGALAS